MISGFLRGIVAYLDALGFISRKGFGRYFLYSGLIGLVIFAICGYAVYLVNPLITSWLENALPWDLNWLSAVSSWLTAGVSVLFFISIFKYLMLIFTAPLMSVLSEKVENEITGNIDERSFIMNVIPELIRALRINLRNIIREIFLTLLLLLLSLIPLFSVFTGILILLVQAYYAGFGNYDFWAERHFTYRSTIRFMKARKGMLAGNGIVYIFILAIPVIGAFLAPPLATVASTMEGVRAMDLDHH